MFSALVEHMDHLSRSRMLKNDVIEFPSATIRRRLDLHIAKSLGAKDMEADNGNFRPTLDDIPPLNSVPSATGPSMISSVSSQR